MSIASKGRSVLNMTRRAASFALDHPSTLVVPTLGAALYATHPVRNADSEMGQAFEGDPNYFRRMVDYSILSQAGADFQQVGQPGLGANITTYGNSPGITTEGSQFSVSPDPDQALRSSESYGANPSGSIVFNLHNNRMR